MKISEEIVEEVVFGNLYRLMTNAFSIKSVQHGKEIYFVEDIIYENNVYQIIFYRLANKRFFFISGVGGWVYELSEEEVLVIFKKRRKKIIDILFLKLLSQRGEENWPGEKFY